MPPLAPPCFFINNIYWPYFKVIQVYLSPLNDISNGMKILREEEKNGSFFLHTFQVHSKKVESVGALCRSLVRYHRVLICHFSNCTAHILYTFAEIFKLICRRHCGPSWRRRWMRPNYLYFSLAERWASTESVAHITKSHIAHMIFNHMRKCNKFYFHASRRK